MCWCLGIRKRPPNSATSGTHGPTGAALSNPHQEQEHEEAPGTENLPKNMTPAPGSATHAIEKDLVITSAKSIHEDLSSPHQEQGNTEAPGIGSEDQLKDVSLLSSPDPAAHAHEKEVVITSIRATNLALGLRRIPAGFHVVVRHSDLEYKTENLPVLASEDVVEWRGPIPIPSDLTAAVSLAVHASFEFQPVLGDGEELRNLTMTVNELLDRSREDTPLSFSPTDENVFSPCFSLFVIVTSWKCESNNLLSKILEPHRSAMESGGQLEDATNQGHSALSRYRRHGQREDLERATEQFQHALNICPLDHPCRAAAESNMATAKFIYYRVYEASASLDLPLTLYGNALDVRPVGHPDRPCTLIQLAAVHLMRFEQRWDEVDRARAGVLLREATALSSSKSYEQRAAIFLLQLHAEHTTSAVQVRGQPSADQSPSLPLTDVDPWRFSAQLLHLFQKHGDLSHLQQAISVLEASVRSISSSDRRYPVGIGNLGLALWYRFNRLGDLTDLEEAISRQQVAVDLTPNDRPEKPMRLNNLGNSFGSRFERLGEISDLGEAISKQQAAVELTPNGHPNKPGYVNNLGMAFKTRFDRFGEISDLEEAISRQRDAVSLTPNGHPNKSTFLTNLGFSLKARFGHFGEISDLDEAISRQQDAVDLTLVGHPCMPVCLNNLGSSLVTRFWRLGGITDLEQGISRQQEAVDLTSSDHPEKPRLLNCLGISFLTRFRRLGEISDLEKAISRQQDAVDLTPDGHPDKPERLNDIGISLVTRFYCLGEISYLEDGVSRQQEAVDLTPNGHPAKAGRLNNLGISFRTRFERLGEISDLEDAILRQRDAVDLTPNGHPDKPVYLNNLGDSLLTRFRRLGELNDLEAALSRHQDAVDLTPNDHNTKREFLNNLGNSFVTRFHCLGEISDLENAISSHQDALDLAPDSHPDKSSHLNSLGNCFRTRFERLGEISDLEDAILRQQDAVDITPDGHSDKPKFLYSLGASFVSRFHHLGDIASLEQAISPLSLAACAPAGRVTVRFDASRLWIDCARSLRHSSLLRAYSVAIGLLPQLAWIGLSLSHRYRELIRAADVVRDAAAAALDSGLPELAAEWLEQGRSVVWGELLQLRSSYDQLASAYPDHARRLRDLSAALEHASSTREKSIFERSDQHRKLAIARDTLLQDIRRLPGFERFLLHREFSELRASAHSGPVVLLNAAKARCDALIVLANVGHVIHVPLPNFTLDRSKELETSLKKFVRDARDDRYGYAVEEEDVRVAQWKAILSSLWKCVVKPVLDALAFSIPGDLSRIFWCPTGPLTFLPIHAAGLYDDSRNSEPGHKVFDFVVSSYIPTLSILAASSKSDTASGSDLRLLAVGQPPSDGQFPLPGVVTELEHIRAVLRNSPSARTTLTESSVGTVEEVLTLMKEADWVHFACHGVQDDRNPANSGLCLANERRLKISDIVSLSRPHGGLAFLSACQTAKGDEALSDEAIHIAAGMLFAGYGGVVGTMWSINDKIAPDVAKDVYEQLFYRNGTGPGIPDYREAAKALHVAVGRLRAQEKGVSFEHWLPFIHVGL